MNLRRQQHSRAGLRSWAAHRYDRKPGTIGGKLTPAALAALFGRDVAELIRSDPASRRAEIQRLHVLGRTAAEIAREMRLDPSAVTSALRSL